MDFAISVVTQPAILFLRRKRYRDPVPPSQAEKQLGAGWPERSGAKRGPKASLGVTGAAFRWMRIMLP
jgi:hypothetical protein